MALILDTGVVYAALDRDDRAHSACRRLLEASREIRVLPSPILPEIDYWVAKYLGHPVMTALIRDIEEGAFRVEDLTREDYTRVVGILEQYGKAGVGFVDAAVLAVTERLGERKLATLDRRHFGMMRPRHIRALTLLPRPE